MKFTKLTIENFLAITEAELTLNDRGLVLIQGVNGDDTSADSNGAGKSSLADALCWALYGETARGVSGDSVINDAAGKGTRVVVEILDGSESYRVGRHRKHKEGKNSLQVRKLNDATGMFDIDLTKGTDKLTQEVVLKIIGASHDVFKDAIYAGQEKMPDLPAMTDKHLKVLIEEASGVTLLEEAYREARERLGQKKAALDQILQTQARAAERGQWIRDQIVSTTAARDVWAVNRQARLDAAKATVVAHVKNVKAHDAEIAKVDQAAITAAIAADDAKIAAVAQENVRLQELTREAANAAGRIQIAGSTHRNAKLLVDKFTNEFSTIQHKVGCPCTECGRPLSEAELASATAAARTRLDDATTQLTAAEKQVQDAQADAQKREGELQSFRATMTDISAVSAHRALKSNELGQVQLLQRQREQVAQAARQAGDIAKTIAAEANPHVAPLGQLEEQVEASDKAIQALADSRRAAEGEVEIAESVVKVFSPAGVRAHILDEVTPFLNQQTAKYLSTLSDGNIEATWTTLVKNGKNELREKFSIEVVKASGSKSFAGLSGGEKRKVRVATALALQDLVATRATKPIELFIGDEIDDALDAAGLERLMQILEDKAKERGSVFVISHNSLRDWISSVVTVEMKGGKTTVTEAIA